MMKIMLVALQYTPILDKTKLYSKSAQYNVIKHQDQDLKWVVGCTNATV